MTEMATLVLLGLALSLDSFRVSLCFGALKLRPPRQAQLVLSFGLCDGLAPLAGILLGQSLLSVTGAWTEYLGPLLLGGYGAWVVYVGRRYGSDRQEPERWIIFGLPLSLSLDNLIAGSSLGMLGFPMIYSVAVIGIVSAMASFAGLRIGRTAVGVLQGNAELFGGVAMVCIAFALALGAR